MVFGMVHSDRTVVGLLHKHFSSSFSLSVILQLITNFTVRTLLWTNPTLCHISAIHSTFTSQLIKSNFSNDCLLLSFHFD
jgi:hypothetical protein